MTGILKCWCWFWPTCVALIVPFQKRHLCRCAVKKRPVVTSDSVRLRCETKMPHMFFSFDFCRCVYTIVLYTIIIYTVYIYNVFPHYIDVFFHGWYFWSSGANDTTHDQQVTNEATSIQSCGGQVCGQEPAAMDRFPVEHGMFVCDISYGPNCNGAWFQETGVICHTVQSCSVLRVWHYLQVLVFLGCSHLQYHRITFLVFTENMAPHSIYYHFPIEITWNHHFGGKPMVNPPLSDSDTFLGLKLHLRGRKSRRPSQWSQCQRRSLKAPSHQANEVATPEKLRKPRYGSRSQNMTRDKTHITPYRHVAAYWHTTMEWMNCIEL